MGFAKRQQILKIHNSNGPTPSPSTLTLTPPIPSTKGSRAGRRGGGVQYDRLIDVLTVQCNSVALEIIGWSFSSPARSTDD